jgi:hypothetical protein
VLQLNSAAPLPGEVLQLSEEQEEKEDALRWRRLYEGTAQAIIDLFDPDAAQPREVLRTSLQRLSRTLDIDVESAREGLASLLNVGDFTASIDIEPAAEHPMFELRVDWDRFYRSRFRVRRAT